MNYWMDEQIARERYIDMVHEERQHRIIALVVAARRRVARQQARFYSPVLAGFGRRLVAWGCGLEARYGAICEPQIATNTGGNAATR
jgi:hypothetical protein